MEQERWTEKDRKHRKELTPRARELRRDMTPEESKLWYCFLRSYPVRVRRQKVIDIYIADFYCHDARLVIELDGAHHYTAEGKKRDENRTFVIERRRLKVIRFSNSEISDNFSHVCSVIDHEIQTRIKAPQDASGIYEEEDQGGSRP